MNNKSFLRIWDKLLENFGLVFGIISVSFIFLTISYILESPNVYTISSVVPFITISAFFGLKLIGFYRMSILEDKRRDIKKALIALTAIQVFTSYGIFTILICILAIPITILEWYPKRSFKYINNRTDKTKTIKALIQS